MNKRILAAFLAVIMVLSCLPVTPVAAADTDTNRSAGTTYYVSNKGAAGNDGTSEAAPFNSLLAINEITLQPGDRVLLERGSVFQNEYLHIKGSGSAEAPIIIDAYGDEGLPKPLIQTNGNGIWYQDYKAPQLDSTAHVKEGYVSSCILLFDVEYIEISNIAMTNQGNYAQGEVYSTAHRMDRTGVAGVAQDKGTIDHIVLKDLDISYIEGNVYNKHLCNGGIYLVCHQAVNEAQTGVARYNGVEISGCSLYEVNRWGIAVGYTAQYGRFLSAELADETCMSYGSTDVYIHDNYLSMVGGDAITTMYCYRPLVERNVATDFATDMNSEIYTDPGSRGGMVAAGIWPWKCKTPIFQYNECYDGWYNQDGQAWDADSGDGCIYQYNYSSGNGGGAVMFCLSQAVNTIFRYNISQNDRSGVLNICGSPNGEIYNNVFYIADGVQVNRTNMSGGTGNSVYNNIFYYTGSAPAGPNIGNWGDIGAVWSNNVYYNFQNIPSDPYAITEDPLFVDPGSGPDAALTGGETHDRSVFDGYKLQANSPAIDAGKACNEAGLVGLDAIEGVNSHLDFFGNGLDLLPDVGVYETGTCTAEGAQTAVKVNVPLNGTATVTDTTGHYTESELTGLNTAVATVELTAGTQPTYQAGEAVTALETGRYVLLSTRANKPMTNASASADGGKGLSLNGTKDILAEGSIWTVKTVNGGYTVQDASGKYLTVGSNTAGLISDEAVVSIAPSGDNWTISQNGAYLNDFGGKGVCAAGWQHSSAAGDAGSQWRIFRAEEDTENGIPITTLTVTGVAPGTTDVLLGTTLYRISVSGDPADAVPSEDLSIRSTVYMLTGNTLHVPGVEGNQSTVGEVLDHVEFAEGVSSVILQDGEEVPSGENVTDGMAVRAVATNGAYTDYPVTVDNIYDYAEDYSFEHQGNVWFYQYIDAAGNYENLSIVGGWQDWMYDWTAPGEQNGSSTTYLTVSRQETTLADGILSGTMVSGQRVNVAAMAWRAPKSGSVTLSFGGSAAAGGAKLRTPNGDNGGTVELWITHNGVKIGEPIQVRSELTAIDDIVIQAQKGDYIRLEAHNFTDSSLAAPSFHVTPVICYNASSVSHTCVYDQRNTAEAYLATAATCEQPAAYYFSCVCGEKGTETFESGEALEHSFDDNGFCSVCDAYEPATEADGVWQISNGGQLYWFAALVNGGETDADAVLTDNIRINENVLVDGALNTEGNFRTWTPMGAKYKEYTGTFDGNNKTVSGLYFNDSAAEYVALFACIGTDSVVKNVTLADSCFSGYRYVAGIVASAVKADISNCHNSSVIVAASTRSGGIVAEIVGDYTKSNSADVSGCTNSGAVSGTMYTGGVVGCSKQGMVTNCSNTGTVTSTGTDGQVGGVVGAVHGYTGKFKAVVSGCTNSGTVSGTKQVGGVVGHVEYGAVENCSNSAGVTAHGMYAGGVAAYFTGGSNYNNILKCFNTGNVTGAGQYVGGVVGLFTGRAASVIENCYNTGNVSNTGNNTGGIAGGYNYGKLLNCYNTGTVSGNKNFASIAGNVTGSAVAPVNCYYLAQSEGDALDGTAFKTAAQFASGEVAYLLNGSKSDESVVWKQTLIGENVDETPNFVGRTVYMGYISCGEDAPPVYSNDSTASATKPDHDWADATCEAPKTCNRCDLTEGEALGHAYGEPVFVWNDTTASATVTCANDAEHVVELDVTVTSVDTEGDCENAPYTTYTATAEYDGETYTAEKVVTGQLLECVDENDDHLCDVCGKELSKCADEDDDHLCDVCGKELSKCADENKDHKCDTCGKELSECADENNDHLCDVCGKELSKCADENKDHKCDTCGKELSKCADENKDHKCDICGKELSECADENKDHKCDICGKELSKCADENKDHKCDTCGKELSNCADEDGDGKCDTCGADLETESTECPKDETCVLSVFTDAELEAWYHDGAHYCVEEGLMNGTGNNKFEPNKAANRAMLVTILWRVEGSPKVDGLENPFSDVFEGQWFYEPVVWAYHNGVVNGTSATTFSPDKSITREQIATILYRYSGSPETKGTLEGFADGDTVAEYAADAMKWAVETGLINGIPKGNDMLIAPRPMSETDVNGNATRAQVATILWRYLTK